MGRTARAIIGGLLALWSVVIGVLALWPPAPGSELSPLLLQLLYWSRGYSWLPALDYDTIDLAANLLLFVPVGVLIGLLVRRAWWPIAVLIGVDAAMVLEIVQLGVLGWSPSWSDVAACAIGAAFGTLAQSIVPRPGARKHPPANAFLPTHGA